MIKALFSTLVLSSLLFFSTTLHAQIEDRVIVFPDVPGYKTLKCDLHQHTVFSDGNVWPSIRVQEAIKDGLDAVSMTDHLEYQPHDLDIPHPDRNRSYQVALEAAENHGLIVINGSEITRSMPPGHSNAIFLEDANDLMVDDSVEVFRAAKNQGAFIFWNHPMWTPQYPDGIAKLSETHKKLIKDGLLNGIEVVNDVTYSDEAVQIALDNNLTMMGTSDIHGLIDWEYDVPQGGHRPATLVFAKEKTEESLKEALLAGRTVVWFKNTLIGKSENLVPLIDACISVKDAGYLNETTVLRVKIENSSDAEFLLENHSPYTFHANGQIVRIAPNATTTLLVKTIDLKSSVELKFKVLNGIIAPNKHPDITLNVAVK